MSRQQIRGLQYQEPYGLQSGWSARAGRVLLRSIMVVAAAFFAAGAAQAQSLPDLKAYLDTIKTDVVATGGLAFNHEGNALFIPDGDRRSFPSQLAVDREVLKKINANCVVNGMFYSVDEMCKADISAEITFDGPTANLLIFEVNNLQPPKGK